MNKYNNNVEITEHLIKLIICIFLFVRFKCILFTIPTCSMYVGIAFI